ncbi:MAG: glycosyltransferase family 4 protein, partial [Roseimicrobium sp.]
AELAGEQVSLTFCGGVDATVRAWAGSRLDKHRIIPWLPRHELATIYSEHDVLVFPTLGDSFGFVAFEAMACGLPVIASTHAGAPLPDESWRVPVRQPEALAQKLLAYASDRALLHRDSMRALTFVRTATADQFRERAKVIFRSLP